MPLYHQLLHAASLKMSEEISEKMSDRPPDSPLFIPMAENTGNGKKLNKKYLVNILNYTNFQDKTVLINFKHTKYNNRISIPAKPQPCMGDSLECIWVESEGFSNKFKTYEFVDIFISYGRRLIIIKPDVKDIDGEKISFILPETCYEFAVRKTVRHPCKDIRVELIQNGAIFYGELIDFSAESFRIAITAVPPQTFEWINPDNSVNIILKNENDFIFSGECKIIKQTNGQKIRTFTLAPLKNNISRFKPKEIRSIRQKLLPSPHIVFKHPITKKIVNLEVDDISGSGFSVEESCENSVMLPGMIIPDLQIEFAADFKLNCGAQIIYRRTENAGDEMFVKCGIAFLDMDIKDQGRLSSILHHASNKKSYVCSKIDLDELWQFFFETGFVYPQKYIHMHANKEEFKQTYERLYNHNPHIARHFVYLEKGIIQGHMSMLRIFENAWLFHHHTSRSISSKAGLTVLDQISRYVNDFYRLHSTKMTFVISYFRPENRFPNRVFGGFAKHLNDPKGCSVDSFACLSFPKKFEPYDIQGLVLSKTQKEDLLELKAFYEHKSGGLMIPALDLETDMIECDNLVREYEKAGFKQEKHLYSLKRDGILKAVFIASVSDFGLNLSNAANCIHAFVIDEENTKRDKIISALSMISKHYEQDEISVLLYPLTYAQNQYLPHEKIYNMWILGIAQKGELFLKYSRNLCTHFLKDRYDAIKYR